MTKVYEMGRFQLVQSLLVTRSLRPKARTKYRTYKIDGAIIKNPIRK